eukprot:COSAG01_NODE_3307_length_6288_cov_62.023913_6_plen_365_part_00
MPKKMGGNDKAVAARERKAAIASQKKAVAAQAAEDAVWADNTQPTKAEAKRAQAEAAREAAKARKQEDRAMAAAEDDAMTKLASKKKVGKAGGKKGAPPKMSVFMIQQAKGTTAPTLPSHSLILVAGNAVSSCVSAAVALAGRGGWQRALTRCCSPLLHCCCRRAPAAREEKERKNAKKAAKAAEREAQALHVNRNRELGVEEAAGSGIDGALAAVGGDAARMQVRAWCMVHGAWCMVHGAWCMEINDSVQFDVTTPGPHGDGGVGLASHPSAGADGRGGGAGDGCGSGGSGRLQGGQRSGGGEDDVQGVRSQPAARPQVREAGAHGQPVPRHVQEGVEALTDESQQPTEVAVSFETTRRRRVF